MFFFIQIQIPEAEVGVDEFLLDVADIKLAPEEEEEEVIGTCSPTPNLKFPPFDLI